MTDYKAHNDDLTVQRASVAARAAGVGTNSGCLLAGLLAVKTASVLPEDNYRKYMSGLTTTVTLGGNTDVSTKSIVYSIGARSKKGQGLRKRSDDTPSVECVLNMPSVFAADFIGASKKYVNFTSDFTRFDMCAVVERLSAGIAFYSLHGVLSPDVLRSNRPYSVTALGHAMQHVIASRNSVFIPRHVDSALSPNTFCALVNAVNGEGGTVVSDMCEVDSSTNRAIVPSASDDELVMGCYHALRILGHMYSMAGGGDMFAYAACRGVHMMLTVVAHSDEGGVTRDVLRRSQFSVPYGGVLMGHDGYMGLPRPTSNELGGWQAWCDGIALASAGLVAYADPCVTIDDMVLPSVFVNRRRELQAAGTEAADDETDGATVAGAIADASGPFCSTYCSLLGKLFCIEGDSGLAAQHMIHCFRSLITTPTRHVKYAEVAPFYWIEPTSVVPIDPDDTLAGRAGYAALCRPAHARVRPLFENATTYDQGGMGQYSATIQWRTARTSMGIVHLHNHAQDGLANIVIRQVDQYGLAMMGTEGTVSERVARNDDIAKYLWQRGDCPVPHPAECLYTKKGMGIVVRTETIAAVGWSRFNMHVFSAAEMAEGVCVVSTTRPGSYLTGKIVEVNRAVKRSRNAASNALASARLGRAIALNETVMAMSMTAPVLAVRGTTNPVGQPVVVEARPLEGGVTQEEMGASGVQQAAVGSAATARGNLLPVRGHLEPVRAPTRPVAVAPEPAPPVASTSGGAEVQ